MSQNPVRGAGLPGPAAAADNVMSHATDVVHSRRMDQTGSGRHEDGRAAAMRQAWLAALAGLFWLCGAGGGEAEEAPLTHKVWIAGPYSFSDELGGFRITGASGTGTRQDPIVIVEELTSASPVTMVIRTVRPIRPLDQTGYYATGFFHLRIVALNNSGLPWMEFEFELQERLEKPSVFGDGLSFDQRREDTGNVYSDLYGHYRRDFEPFDRLRFERGGVNHGRTVTFGFFVTDFTPRWEFFLVQDPRIPAS